MLGSLLMEFQGDPIPEARVLQHRIDAWLKKKSALTMWKSKRIPLSRMLINPTYVEAVTLGHKFWNEAIDYFKDKKYTIEIYSVIIALWGSEAQLLSKDVGLTEERIHNFMKTMDGDHETQTELRAYEVARYLSEKINNEGR